MEIHKLFPATIGESKYENSLSNEIEFIKQLETKRLVGNSATTKHDILTNPELSNIKVFIEEKLSEYFKQVVNPALDTSIYITESWANYTNKDEYHHTHTHPNSYFSGVFYLMADDRIEFYNERKEVLEVDKAEYNHYNSASWWMPAKTGCLFLFSSKLKHSVPPVTGDYTRISIAFNTFLKGAISTRDAVGLVL